MTKRDPLVEALRSMRAKAGTPAELRLLDLLPASLLNRDQMSNRDAAVLDAFAAVSGKDPTPAAKYIAEQFARYLGSAWLIERGYPLLASENPLRAALQRLARENGGETIGPRQLLRIRDGARR
jgi:hypothetical protein